jgi:hypothetical protein
MREETSFERRAYGWSAVAAPVLAAAFCAWLQLDGRESGPLALLTHAGLSLFVVGKFIVFAGLKQGAFSSWQLAAMVFLMDLFFAFLLASGIQVLERAPWLGRGLRKARARALEVLAEYPGLERRAVLGVALFVFLPLAGTGAITGSFLARIFGLSRADGVAALGSALTALIFALLAQFVGARPRRSSGTPCWPGSRPWCCSSWAGARTRGSSGG